MRMSEESTSDQGFEPYIRALGHLDLGSYDDKNGDPCVETTFDGQYKLEKLLRKDRHADVYSLWSISRNISVKELEARVYVIENIPDKLRRYRLKSIKRLSSRTVLEVRKHEMVVVLYKVDNVGVIGSKNGMLRETTPPNDQRGEGTQNTKAQRKSDHQRETARLRQLERRKLNRRKAQQKKTEPNHSDSKAVMEAIEEETDEEETLYVLLHLAYNDRPELRQKLPPASRSVLEKYLQIQPLQFENGDEMEAFMAIKLREVRFLDRQQKKLPDIESRRKKEYADLLIQRFLLRDEPEEYKSMQNRVKIAQHKLKVIRHVQQLLPKVVGDADNIYRDLRQRLKLVREVLEKIEEFKALRNEWDKLKRMVSFWERISQEVMPGSNPYAQAVSQLQAARGNLRRFDARIVETSEPLLELFKEYKNLLAAPIKATSIEVFIAK